MHGAENSWTLIAGRVRGHWETIPSLLLSLTEWKTKATREPRDFPKAHRGLQPEPRLGDLGLLGVTLAPSSLLPKGSCPMTALSGLTVKGSGPRVPQEEDSNRGQVLQVQWATEVGESLLLVG